MNTEMPKTYDPAKTEHAWYEKWEKNGYFHAAPNPDKTPFTIVIPPPNITGKLHMGHALDNTLQDILLRWRRMQGYDTLWLPGTDHASIATEAKIVAALRAKRIPSALIEQYCAQIPAEDYQEQLRSAIEKWQRLHPNVEHAREKLIRHLLTKGYGMGEILKTLH